MSYRTTMTGIDCSLISRDDDGDEFEHTLKVEFDAEFDYEPHPYGSTVAYEPITEIGDVREYLLDGEPVTLQYLNERFGKEAVDKAVDACADCAEEDS